MTERETDGTAAGPATPADEHSYRRLFERANLGAFKSTVDGRLMAANAAYARMFGFASPEEVVASVRDVAADLYADPARRPQVVEQIVRGDGAVHVENLYRRRDGSLFTGMLHAWRIDDRSGRPLGIEGLVEDISERKRAEAQIRVAAEHYRYALNALPDPVFVKDEHHRWKILNDAFCHFMGYPRERLLGKSDVDFFPAEEAAVFWAKDDEVFANGRENVNEEKFTSADGTQHTISTKKTVYVDSVAGRPILVGVIRDMTEAHRAAAELERYREHLEDVVRERTRELEESNQRLRREATERSRADDLRAAIYEISEAAQQGAGMGELLATVHAAVGRFMDATNLSIALYDGGSGLITIPYSAGAARPAPFPPGDGLTSRVLRSGKPLLGTPEMLGEIRRRGQLAPCDAGAVSWLGVPLIVGERTIGVLAVRTEEAAARYGERDQEVLTFVSRQVATAIERTRAEEALRDSEERFRSTVEELSEGLVLVDEEGRIVAWNAAVERILGITREQALGRPLWEVEWEAYLPERKTPERYEYFKESVVKATRDGVLPQLPEEATVRSVDGTICTVRQTVFAIKTDKGYRVGTVYSDITDRKRAEEELRASEERYRLVFQRAPVGVFHYDAALRITDCNDRFAQIIESDRDRLLGLDLNTFEDERLLPAIRAAVQGRDGEYVGPYLTAAGSTNRAGSLRTAPLRGHDGTIIGGVGIVEDLTEHLQLEEQLRQSQRMEAVGHLAGGVAHDFNNIMQAMLSQAQLLRGAGGDAARVSALAGELEEQIERGASLTRQLLLFSRRETRRPELVDLNDAVREAARLLRRLVRENIAVEIEAASAPLVVEADRGQLQQVLMNLAVNASDAMAEGGRLTIRTAAGEPGWVTLAVADTGHGVPDAIRDRIFEPFFTTKVAGRGTGLGLSVVHGIVTSHGGRIEVESAAGRGSSFTVVLPSARSAAGPAGETRRTGLPPLAAGSGERVLIVEDEDGARAGLCEILTGLGYAVAAAASGEEALALPTAPAFQLLLTDLILPGAGGLTIATVLQRRWPGLRVILMSGYTEDEVVRDGVSTGLVRFLQKPFNMEKLAREVRAALDEAGSAGSPPRA